MNNFVEYTMLQPYPLTEYIGFTENEVKELCCEKNMNFDEMKRWYDGYDYDEVGAIYNPNSVVQAATRRKFGSYWNKTGIRQIKEKRYNGKLANYLDNIVLVSINYDKETKKHECNIEIRNEE